MQGVAKKWWVLISMCLITMILAIDATALNVALPVISNEFQQSLTNVQWVINAFFLLAAMVQILGGHLGDSYGHKKVFLSSILLFIASSVGAGFATNEWVLIVCRALQGASIGVAYPQTIVLISEAFDAKQQSYARSFVVATMGIGLAAGAPLGGLFVHTIGWRWIFFINIPIGLALYILAQIACPKKQVLNRHSIDYKAVVLLILGLLGLTVAINQMQNWSIVLFSAVFLAGAAFIYLLYRREKDLPLPLFDFSLFKLRNFSINNGLRLIVGIIFLAILFFLPLYLQNTIEVSALTSGYTMFALTLVMSIVSPFAGKWIDRAGERKANFVTMTILMIASCLLLFVTGTPNFFLLASALFLFGIGIAMGYVSTMTGALAVAPPKKMGRASGLFSTIAWLSCAAGVAISGTLIARVSVTSLTQQLAAHHTTLSSSQYHLAERIAKGISPASTLPAVKAIAAHAFAESIHANAYLFIGLCLIGLFLTALQRSRFKRLR